MEGEDILKLTTILKYILIITDSHACQGDEAGRGGDSDSHQRWGRSEQHVHGLREREAQYLAD